MTKTNESAPAKQAETRHIPGEEGVWVFIGGDLIIFAVFFITYAVARTQEPALFASSQAELNRGLGLANTLILLTSSWFVARAVAAARIGAPAARRNLCFAVALGVAFAVLKAVEYSEKIAAGFTLNSNNFFIYYYMFTGIHLLHVIVGLGVLLWTITRFDKGGKLRGNVSAVEGSGVFWHLVDLLWIILFALLYLV